MSLEEYKKKRNFSKTNEPNGGKTSGGELRFVVQKHAASHLHYDFRLEMRGVLKSWAIPKGPSMITEKARLAMLVEDHPYNYLRFEGMIPEGQYGAGTVIVWDEGTYETPESTDKSKKAQEHSLLKQFYAGALLIKLSGQKLKGQFGLIKAPDKGRNSWYLLKANDEHSLTTDILKEDKSVISGATIEELATDPSASEWQSNRKKPEQSASNPGNSYKDLLQKGQKAPMPKSISPMNCTLIKEIFNDSNWIYEVKFDGYRIVSFINNSKVRLQSRGGLDYTDRYEMIAEELKKLRLKVVLDGEIVVLDKKGKISFDALQKYQPGNPIIYYVFDVLWANGYDLSHLSTIDRKTILKQLLPENELIQYAAHFEDGNGLWQEVQELELEGIVAKKKSSQYYPNRRSKEWLKLPSKKRQEFVIGGWAESAKARAFRSLLFGAYNNKGELEWIGRSGGGYKESEMPSILKKLKAIEIDKSPFVNKVLDTKGATLHYVKPKLVANFEFAAWTTSGRIRKPATFLGFRKDKQPADVVREVPLTEKQERRVIHAKAALPKRKDEIRSPAGSNWRLIEKEVVTSHQQFEVGGEKLELTNVEKEIWPGIFKAELIEYYHRLYPVIYPYIKDRPQSLHIKNINANAPGFYIKDMEGRQPQWTDIFSVRRKHARKGKRNVIDYLVCNNEASLLYIINLGCIDVNPWNSKTTDYLHPDYVVVDLDPSDEDFKKVIETAKAAKQYFEELGINAFPKTSGKTGMHLYIPCKGFSYPEARRITVHMCEEIQKLVKNITTTEVTISKRGKRLFIDYSQNDEADTLAAPYCIRPFKEPRVSAPLQWREINSDLHPSDFTIHNIEKRLKKKGEIFIDVLDEKTATRNSRILKNLW